ncbi:OmpA family protein [Roseovarius aestuarii]|nr:OmpA family protein [Roseovarius aestuarii]
MTRNWLTSTTAIALMLHTAAPLPAFAEGEGAANSASEILGTAGASQSGENSTNAVEAARAAQKQIEEAAKAQAEADAAAAAQAAAQAQAEDAAAQAAAVAAEQAEAEARAKAQAESEAQAATQAEAEAAAKAQADADAAAAKAAEAEAEAQQAAQNAANEEAAAEAKAQQQAEAEAEAEADKNAAQKAKDVTEQLLGTMGNASGQSRENLPQANAQQQAEAAQRAAEQAAQSAAASSNAEAVSTSQGTVTEAEARTSSEEFSTTASGQAQPQAAPAKKDNNNALKVIGVAAAVGLGAYAVGRLLDDGGRVVSNTGDRAVIEEPDGQYRIIKDDDTLLRRPGSNVRTETFSDGSTRTFVTGVDGTRTVTVRAANGQVLQRSRILTDGREVMLFDDTRSYEAVDVTTLRPAQQDEDFDYSTARVDDLRVALAASSGSALPNRAFSLSQIRRIDAVRHLVPVIALDEINFETGSAVILPAEAQALSDLGVAMRDAIDVNPAQVFLIEGHTDTVGDARYNLALSDRRAESVALALTEYFDVPPANMVVQGYGEADLRVRREGNIRANRRGAVRNITPLLTGTDG